MMDNLKYIFSNWRNFLFEDKRNSQGLLPLDVLNFLIEKYAVGLKVRTGYFDFKDFNDSELENNVAVYIAPSKTILINRDEVAGKFGSTIRVLLHEIRHFLQHILWEQRIDFREKFSKGYKLPDKDLKDLSWEEVLTFWNKVYDYESRPHEKDALKWAESNVKEAAQMVIDREKDLKLSKKMIR